MNADDSHSPGYCKIDDEIPSVMLTEKVMAALKIDRLTLLMDLHPEDYENAKSHLLSQSLSQADEAGAVGIVPLGPKAKQGATVGLAAKVPIKKSPLIWSTETAAIVQMKRRKSGAWYLRIELSPQGLTPSGFGYLAEHLFAGVLLTHPATLLHARVSRIDIALDLFGVRLRDYAWQRKPAQVWRPWARAGVLETLYQGSPKHGASCIYDKAIEQELGDDVAWTRLELRPKPNVPLGKLPLMENFFDKVSVLDVRSACAAIGAAEPYREMALAYAHLHGAARLPLLFPDTVGPAAQQSPRKGMKTALEKAVPEWWHPEEIWKLWPAALAYALPDLMTSFKGPMPPVGVSGGPTLGDGDLSG